MKALVWTLHKFLDTTTSMMLNLTFKTWIKAQWKRLQLIKFWGFFYFKLSDVVHNVKN